MSGLVTLESYESLGLLKVPLARVTEVFSQIQEKHDALQKYLEPQKDRQRKKLTSILIPCGMIIVSLVQDLLTLKEKQCSNCGVAGRGVE